MLALGIEFPKLVGGVNVTDVVPVEVKPLPIDNPVVFPVVPPKAYVSLCLNELLAGAKLIVTALPIVTDVALNVGVVARGIAFKVNDPLPVQLTAV